MSKIGIVTKHLDQITLDLARHLVELRHEVVIITSAESTNDPSLNIPSEIQILSFFKKWTMKEIFSFVLRTIPEAPDIWQIQITSAKDDMIKLSHLFLIQLIRTFPLKRIGISFRSQLKKTLKTKIACMSVDFVTVPTREDLMYMKRNGWNKTNTLTEILGPILTEKKFLSSGNHKNSDSKGIEDLEKLIRNCGPYLYHPGPLPKNLEMDLIKKLPQVIIKDKKPAKKPHAKFIYVGCELTNAQQLILVQNSMAVWISSLPFDTYQLLQLQILAAQSKVPIIANPKQSEALPGLCIPFRSGFIVQNEKQVFELFHHNEFLELENPRFQSISEDLKDSALNCLNRIYSKVEAKPIKKIVVARDTSAF